MFQLNRSSLMAQIGKSFDDPLLQEYMRNFYGYGSYEAAYWFVGMEEGGADPFDADSFDEVAERLTVWDRRGRLELEDIAAYHLELGITDLFGDKPKLQPTWAKLIHLLLSMKGRTPTTDEVRSYQQQLWARSDGHVCLLELLPLPSPSTSHWIDARHATTATLASRGEHRQLWSRVRLKTLEQRITVYRPKVVICYGLSCLPFWVELTGAELEPLLAGNIYLHRGPSTLYAVVKHPIARRVTSEYFQQAGHLIRSALYNGYPMFDRQASATP
jgi:hypothetical protein